MGGDNRRTETGNDGGRDLINMEALGGDYLTNTIKLLKIPKDWGSLVITT